VKVYNLYMELQLHI